MDSITRSDRIKGALMGTIIGDALGLGPHWYYDLDELKALYGEWIDSYMPPKPNPNFPLVWKARAGLKAGDVSQTGQVFILLLESVAESGVTITSKTIRAIADTRIVRNILILYPSSLGVLCHDI